MTIPSCPPCTSQSLPAPLIRGATAWSRKLQWGIVSGDIIRQRYGTGGGELGRPAMLTVARAAKAHMCRDCLGAIPKGSLYGVSPAGGSHYCPACIVTDEPASVFKPGRAA